MKEIILTQNKITLIDDADYDLVSAFSWHFALRYLDKGYAATRFEKYGPLVYLHRFLLRNELKSVDDLVVDHIDRDGLNNQRNNLRLVTLEQNAANRSIQSNNKSGVPGVHFCKRTRKWKISYKGQSRGYFKQFDDAVSARRFIEQTEGAF